MPRLENLNGNLQGKYYRKLCEIIPSHDGYSKLYRCMTKNIENIDRSQKICWYIQQVCDATIIF